MIPAPSELRPCRDCTRPILWTTTAAARRLAVDPTPDDTGNQACYRDTTGTWRSRSLNGSSAPTPADWEDRFVPHVATCPNRRPVQTALPAAPPARLPANVIRFDPARRRTTPPTRTRRRS
ncbi:hypothetical protein [Sphaerimonospora thailandensis]|uniref:Uncharacterized protein n=1 Tax=Sphaerimonospora thailandensis TaxID=795644 RepID=A0A8J3R9C4_9ACTN|nr:hypothetical protein [Sphaerimonospora thailandensis]GIH70305.1 hypothetical protein Mth01_25580 [Sphaerimonospora thailandensis]